MIGRDARIIGSLSGPRNFARQPNHLPPHVKRGPGLGAGSAAELAALLLVVPAVEHVPLSAARNDPLRHAGARQLVETAVEVEAVGERPLGLVQEQTLVADGAQLLGADRLQERVGEEGEAPFGQSHRTNPRAWATRWRTSCSTLRRSRSSRRTPG